MKGDSASVADLGDVLDGLHDTRLVVCSHHRDQLRRARRIVDHGLQGFHIDDTRRQERHESLLRLRCTLALRLPCEDGGVFSRRAEESRLVV